MVLQLNEYFIKKKNEKNEIIFYCAFANYSYFLDNVVTDQTEQHINRPVKYRKYSERFQCREFILVSF